MEHLSGILFIDIETVPLKPDYSLLSEPMKEHWDKKARQIKPGIDGNLEPAMVFNDKAGVYSEFAKVVCIGFGSLQETKDGWKMRLKALTGDHEKDLLNDFFRVVERFSAHYRDFRFCGHNIKEFDLPFLCRRMIVNKTGIPDCMQTAGKKPWEVNHLDTMELWKFGDFKHYTTLSLLAEIFGIPSPKSDLDGSMVADAYWQDKDLPRIGKYCLQDVLTTAKVYLRMKGYFDIDPTPVYLGD